MMTPIQRRTSRVVHVGDVPIGGDHPIAVQSMTTADTRDARASIDQIHQMEQAGCEIVRVSVLNMDAAYNLSAIKRQINIPLVADIHFDHRLALEAIKQGVDKVRLNPGNIQKPERIQEVVQAAKDAGVPIRVGVNSGSLPKDLLIKHEGATPEAMVEAGLREIEILENEGFKDIVISLKSTDVRVMIGGYRLMAEQVDYPLHLGVTESGMGDEGVSKSALGIGSLLEQGIGDTLRVSLTGDPTREVKVAYHILGALNLRWRGVQFSSCPTCGRIGIDLEKIVSEAQERLENVETAIKVSLIGCVVNGIGEAGHSHIGLVGYDQSGTLFKDGEPVRQRIPEDRIVDELVDLVHEYEAELRSTNGQNG